MKVVKPKKHEVAEVCTDRIHCRTKTIRNTIFIEKLCWVRFTSDTTWVATPFKHLCSSLRNSNKIKDLESLKDLEFDIPELTDDPKEQQALLNCGYRYRPRKSTKRYQLLDQNNGPIITSHHIIVNPEADQQFVVPPTTATPDTATHIFRGIRSATSSDTLSDH